MSARWSTVAMVAWAVPAAAAPLDQPDLDAASQITVTVDGQRLPGYHHEVTALQLGLGVTVRVPRSAVAVGLAVPLALVTDEGFAVGGVTASALAVRAVNAEVTVGAGLAWTPPTAAGPARFAHAMARDGFRYFTAGSVVQAHGDLRWRRGRWALQGQLGVDDYVMADWPDQVLVRAAAGGTVVLAGVAWTLQGTVLTDALDEESDEGADVVDSVSVGAQLPLGRAVVGVHGTRHASTPASLVPAVLWSVGVDVSFRPGTR